MFHNPCLCHENYDLEFFPQSLALCSCESSRVSLSFPAFSVSIRYLRSLSLSRLRIVFHFVLVYSSSSAFVSKRHRAKHKHLPFGSPCGSYSGILYFRDQQASVAVVQKLLTTPTTRQRERLFLSCCCRLACSCSTFVHAKCPRPASRNDQTHRLTPTSCCCGALDSSQLT